MTDGARTPLDLERLDAVRLLGRAEADLPLAPALAALRGRRLLVTGAAGSVGTALAHRLLACAPAALVLLDSHEHSLFLLDRQLQGAPQPPVCILGDVRNEAKLRTLFRQQRPEIVFHLAAYKHVHFGEAQPDEPIAVNVLATQRLAEIARAAEVAAFVYTSSDKAVSPSGAYGATKRLAELVVRAAGQTGGGRFVAVRFVNVLGTRGSVVETFADQLAARRPLTITDPSMTRYWMSMREAVDLLIAAAGLGANGATLLLDAGEPVPVLALAQRLSALLGYGDSPAVQITRPRPGERLAEVLASPREALAPGPLPGTWAVTHADAGRLLGEVPRVVETLAAAIRDDDPGLAARLVALANELV